MPRKITTKSLRLLLIFISFVLVIYLLVINVGASNPVDLSSKGWANPVSPMEADSSWYFDSPEYLRSQGVRHAGMDLFPDNSKSKPVYAIADGYVYHVNLDPKADLNQSVISIRHETGRGI